MFRVGGVVEHLGDETVQELNLVTLECTRKQTKTTAATTPATSNDRVAPASAGRQNTTTKRRRTKYNDVEPSDPETADEHELDDVDYPRTKRMSGDMFKYFVCADSAKQENMQVTVSASVQQVWQHVIIQDAEIKLDDLDDALLHAVNAVLCSGSRYRQLMPSSVSLHNNRTVVLTHSGWYFIVNGTHLNSKTSALISAHFSRQHNKSEQTVTDIKQTLLQHLQTA